MSLLETLICLLLVSLLAGVSVSGYQDLITRTRLNADAQLIASALHHARDRATRAHPAQVSCESPACKVLSKEGETLFTLSGLHQVKTALFPAQAQGVLTFNHAGMTDFQNGSIEVSHPDKEHYLKKIVVSQGGRISLR